MSCPKLERILFPVVQMKTKQVIWWSWCSHSKPLCPPLVHMQVIDSNSILTRWQNELRLAVSQMDATKAAARCCAISSSKWFDSLLYWPRSRETKSGSCGEGNDCLSDRIIDEGMCTLQLESSKLHLYLLWQLFTHAWVCSHVLSVREWSVQYSYIFN